MRIISFKYCILLAILVCNIIDLSAQVRTGNKCIDDVMTIYIKYLHLQDSLAKGSMLHVKCLYAGNVNNIDDKDTISKPYSYNYEMYLGNKYKEIVAENFSYYDDAHESFYILNDVKQIYNSNSTNSQMPAANQNFLFNMYDSAYSKMRLISCEYIQNTRDVDNENSNTNKSEDTIRNNKEGSSSSLYNLIVKVALPQYIYETDMTEEYFITYYVNTISQTIYKVSLFNPSKSVDIGLAEITYQKIEILPDTFKNASIRSHVYGKGAKLLPMYIGYEVLDLENRNIDQSLERAGSTRSTLEEIFKN